MSEKWVSRIVVIVAVLVAWWSWTVKQNADREALIASENALAAQDTVRVLRLGKDGERAAYVLALQQAQVTLRSAEARLAKQEKLLAKVKADLSVAVKGIDTVYVGPTEHATTTIDSIGQMTTTITSLRDSLTLTGPPITGSVTADLSPTRPSRWAVRLTPDPIPLTVIVGCRKVGPPEIAVIAPNWGTVVPSVGTVDPALCHPKKGPNRLIVAGLGVALGVLGYRLLR